MHARLFARVPLCPGVPAASALVSDCEQPGPRVAADSVTCSLHLRTADSDELSSKQVVCLRQKHLIRTPPTAWLQIMIMGVPTGPCRPVAWPIYQHSVTTGNIQYKVTPIHYRWAARGIAAAVSWAPSCQYEGQENSNSQPKSAINK